MPMKATQAAVSIVFVCVAALVNATCGSVESTSPTAPTQSTSPSPTPSPTPTPAPAPAPAPNGTASVKITINPNPVPRSSTPITDVAGCVGVASTWFYDQVLEETAGVAVTFSDRENFFDGRSVSKQANANIAIPARGKITVATRWCSSTATSHTAQSNFSGSDANGHVVTANGPQVNLR